MDHLKFDSCNPILNHIVIWPLKLPRLWQKSNAASLNKCLYYCLWSPFICRYFEQSLYNFHSKWRILKFKFHIFLALNIKFHIFLALNMQLYGSKGNIDHQILPSIDQAIKLSINCVSMHYKVLFTINTLLSLVFVNS